MFVTRDNKTCLGGAGKSKKFVVFLIFAVVYKKSDIKKYYGVCVGLYSFCTFCLAQVRIKLLTLENIYKFFNRLFRSSHFKMLNPDFKSVRSGALWIKKSTDYEIAIKNDDVTQSTLELAY